MGKEVNKALVAIVLFMTVAVAGSFYVKSNSHQPHQPQQSEQPIYQPVKPEQPIQPVEPENTYEDALASITKADLKEMLYHLADYDVYKGRVTGQPGNVAAAEWIKKKLESYGLETMYDEFNTSYGKTKNVYAWINGNEVPDEVIVVGAHFDHISKSPGADDNASGTVLTLELAQAFAMLPKEDVRRTIVFQLYSGEEEGLLGSRHYCENPKFPKGSPNIRNHVFMLNSDMVGRLGTQQYFMLFNEEMDDVGQMVQDLSDKYPFALSITKRGAGGSDHTPFLNKGVNVGWLFTGTHRDYHRPTDTPDKIDYDGLEKISRYAFELVHRIDRDKRHLCILNTDYENNAESFVHHDVLYDHNDPRVPFPQPLLSKPPQK